ncbi:uncharacterized protein DDB_G0283357-like [Musca domestica]|nr:uncharacterized protein DDB_G0283357-like [Musca domestica]
MPMSSSGETLCGAISPTTSVASAGIPGVASGNASIYLRSLATDENTCSTLPHMPTSSSSSSSSSAAAAQQSSNVSGLPPTNMQLNRNLVMLRNHLRKNTNTTTSNNNTQGNSNNIGSSSNNISATNNHNMSNSSSKDTLPGPNEQ